MQMFDPRHNLGRVLYLDLDTVITKNIDWMWQLNEQYFWAIKDFKYLWRTTWNGINSSVMIWDTKRFTWIWDDFASKNINATVKLFHGDQDYLNTVLSDQDRRFIDIETIKSWRWQCKDGGMDMRTRQYQSPNAGTVIDSKTAVIIFHGRPKPHEVVDPVIAQYWN
jgi:lipopolysaccharide biosynthesis glycosyltransferase